jgi:hypothetical protein
MFVPTLSLSGFPNGAASGLDMTADFAPLFIGLWVILGLCVLGLTVLTAVYDTWWEPRKAKQPTAAVVPVPDLPKAA